MIGKYRGTILHYGQPKPWVDKIKCSKCLLGHKQSGCRKEAFSDHGDDSSSESDTMENEKKEDHIDDEDDVIDNWQDKDIKKKKYMCR